jgi:hypothetical protein
MQPDPLSRRLRTVPLALGALYAGACASAPAPVTAPVAATGTSRTAPSPDPRVGLKAGWFDAGDAIWNLAIVSKTPPSASFINASTPGDARLKNSDLAFRGTYVFQGNYSGYQVWDIADPRKPALRAAVVCPGSQSDVSVYKHLLFVSAEATSGRTDCGLQGVEDTVSHHRARGIRIFDITDVSKPRAITTVQTCRGSHTNTLVTDPRDTTNVYIYVSGSAGVRSPSELAGCSGAAPEEDPNSALFRIEVIRVPVAHPEQAAIVSAPRIFEGLTAPPRHAEPEPRAPRAGAADAAAAAGAAPRPSATRGPTQCHDITAYPAIGLAGGACGGYGLLLDIRDVAHPKRISAVADSNFSFWHSATFSNDGSKVLFSDEWGGGTAPRCRATDKKEWGADAIFTIDGSDMHFESYYKLPAPQTSTENCVAHNGTLIPIPGREVMVQSWYQGGLSVFDWTDASNPVEIAFYDMGPMDSTKLVSAGYWSAYWYNGYLVGSEISRGLDLFALRPSAWISQNEIDAANTVRFEYLNAQEQPKLVWPATFALAKAYVDQLARVNALPPTRTAEVMAELTRAERTRGADGRTALLALASRLGGESAASGDAAKVRALAATIADLAK